ncbi:ObirOr5-V14 [Ooceraea biroi]|uniref:Odorant receptor n=1 Tax=Ooceraea biroi TaxID=2015173 RepID=A0A026WNJ1_OOCBI|nr:odorant receptor 22c [Ooceraea biroi]EZA57543.1 hypothetical protein X777_02079 [Ooceraea biroi]RLU24764.1 ObirOr5-V14 [Ooceraea biroi]
MEISTVSRVVKIGLRACGIWPYLPTTTLYRFFWIVMLGIAQIFQYQYVVIHYNTDNFSHFMDGVSSAMTYSLLFVKLTILWANQRTFSDILQMMAVDWENCVLADRSLRITTDKVKLSHRFSKWIIGLQLTVINPIQLRGTCCNIQRINVSAREYILKMKLPFTVSTSPIYVLITILQFFYLAIYGCGISMVNSLIVTLILHIGGQIDILRECLLTAFSKNMMSTVDSITLRTLITKHQQIIIFSENIENLYTYIALMLFVSDTPIICCLGFIIVTSIGTTDGPAILVRSVLFYLVMNLEAFIYCFAGEYLSAKSKMIGDAAYNSLWYDVATKKNLIILFIILRSQKRLTITIGKVMDLSLERFTSVVKASASYISVLLAMY